MGVARALVEQSVSVPSGKVTSLDAVELPVFHINLMVGVVSLHRVAMREISS